MLQDSEVKPDDRVKEDVVMQEIVQEPTVPVQEDKISEVDPVQDKEKPTKQAFISQFFKAKNKDYMETLKQQEQQMVKEDALAAQKAHN